MAFAVITPI
jgi:hypothetical protein